MMPETKKIINPAKFNRLMAFTYYVIGKEDDPINYIFTSYNRRAVYRTLHESHPTEMTARDIMLETSIPESSVYKTLKELNKKGLVMFTTPRPPGSSGGPPVRYWRLVMI